MKKNVNVTVLRCTAPLCWNTHKFANVWANGIAHVTQISPKIRGLGSNSQAFALFISPHVIFRPRPFMILALFFGFGFGSWLSSKSILLFGVSQISSLWIFHLPVLYPWWGVKIGDHIQKVFCACVHYAFTLLGGGTPLTQWSMRCVSSIVAYWHVKSKLWYTRSDFRSLLALWR